MKEAVEKIKSELNAKFQLWNNVKSVKIKMALILIFVALVGLKVFTTVLTFDWIANFF